MPRLEKLARFAGARLILRELVHEKTVKRGATLNLNMKWANVGVGKLHHPYVLRFFLLGAEGQPVLATEAKADPRQWLPGEHDLAESMPLPATCNAGDYAVAVALVDPAGQHRLFRLAVDAPEQQGRYVVSRVIVE